MVRALASSPIKQSNIRGRTKQAFFFFFLPARASNALEIVLFSPSEKVYELYELNTQTLFS